MPYDPHHRDAAEDSRRVYDEYMEILRTFIPFYVENLPRFDAFMAEHCRLLVRRALNTNRSRPNALVEDLARRLQIMFLVGREHAERAYPHPLTGHPNTLIPIPDDISSLFPDIPQ